MIHANPADNTGPDRLSVQRYPVGRAAKHYADVIKPALVDSVRALGYKVGSYDGRGGLPKTTLLPRDPDSPIHCLIIYWRGGLDLEVGVRSKEWKRQMQTPLGQIAHAMSFGVHEAYGHPLKGAATFRVAVTTAIVEALRRFETKEAD